MNGQPNVKKTAVKTLFSNLANMTGYSASDDKSHKSVSRTFAKPEESVKLPKALIPENMLENKDWKLRLTIEGNIMSVDKDTVEIGITDHSCSIDKPMNSQSDSGSTLKCCN
jgi:hypothetical protein